MTNVVRYFVVACDPEVYETLECTDIIEGWRRMMFYEPHAAPGDDVEAFALFAGDGDNWRDDPEGNHAVLTWDVGGESSATITFYRITHSQP